jgi:hypothetical protein
MTIDAGSIVLHAPFVFLQSSMADPFDLGLAS